MVLNNLSYYKLKHITKQLNETISFANYDYLCNVSLNFIKNILVNEFTNIFYNMTIFVKIEQILFVDVTNNILHELAKYMNIIYLKESICNIYSFEVPYVHHLEIVKRIIFNLLHCNFKLVEKYN
jgi:hypothetical protein